MVAGTTLSPASITQNLFPLNVEVFRVLWNIVGFTTSPIFLITLSKYSFGMDWWVPKLAFRNVTNKPSRRPPPPPPPPPRPHPPTRRRKRPGGGKEGGLRAVRGIQHNWVLLGVQDRGSQDNPEKPLPLTPKRLHDLTAILWEGGINTKNNFLYRGQIKRCVVLTETQQQLSKTLTGRHRRGDRQRHRRRVPDYPGRCNLRGGHRQMKDMSLVMNSTMRWIKSICSSGFLPGMASQFFFEQCFLHWPLFSRVWFSIKNYMQTDRNNRNNNKNRRDTGIRIRR